MGANSGGGEAIEDFGAVSERASADADADREGDVRECGEIFAFASSLNNEFKFADVLRPWIPCV